MQRLSPDLPLSSKLAPAFIMLRMRFQAELEISQNPVAVWTIAYMPFDARQEFGSGGIIRVHGTINGFPFSSSIFPSKSGRHFLMVNKKMQKGARASEPGEVVEITMELDSAPKKVTVPAALRTALNANNDARKFFDDLPPSSQRYRVEMITDAKPANRAKRIQALVENLAELERAEKQTPEYLQRALDKNAAARAKYAKLAKTHKRVMLIYIIGGKSQETRNRRVAKSIKVLLEKGHF